MFYAIIFSFEKETGVNPVRARRRETHCINTVLPDAANWGQAIGNFSEKVSCVCVESKYFSNKITPFFQNCERL